MNCLLCFNEVISNNSIICINCNSCICNECFESLVQVSNINDLCCICNLSISKSLCSGIHCINCNNSYCIDLMKPYDNLFIKSSEEIVKEKKEIVNCVINLSIIGECMICIDEITINDIIACISCNKSCCKSCYKRYLLDSTSLIVNCMFCNQPIDQKFHLLHLDNEWLNNEYRLHRSNLLMLSELKNIDEARNEALAYSKAKAVLRILPFHPETFEYRGNAENLEKYTRHMQILYQARNCVTSYGRGYIGFDFETGVMNDIESVKITRRCPNNDCCGYVIEQIEEYLECNLCFVQVCIHCNEIIVSSNQHECDKDILASIQIISKDSKPCPVCSAYIHKIEGCDQMFCTICHTTFSWSTSRIETGFKHNPHYLDWIREKRLQSEKSNDTLPINYDHNRNIYHEYLTYNQLMRCFTPDIWNESFHIRNKLPKIESNNHRLSSKTLYCLALRNYHSNLLTIRSTIGNHTNVPVPDNHDLYIQYLNNEISENEIKIELEKRESHYYKNIQLFYIYDLVFRSASNIFYSLFSKSYKKEKYYQSYYDLRELIIHGNSCIDHYDKVFKPDEPSVRFQLRPF